MKLYAISDTRLTPHSTLPQTLISAIDAGIDMFQFRDKDSADSEIRTLCATLNEICQSRKIPFILNDRANLAIEINAMGLHLGKDDENAPFSEIRARFRGILGISCYGDINRALRYEKMGADYVAFGSIFPSKTKPDSGVIGTKILREAKAHLKIPICAIGGINADNIATLKNADMVAIIGAIWDGDFVENIRTLKNAIKTQ